MAQISYNTMKKHQSRGLSDSTMNSKLDIVSIRDSLLNKIISNHLKGNFDVISCVKNKDKFVGISKFEDFSASCKGLKSFDSYKSLVSEAELKEFLASCELKSDEIDILLEKGRLKGKQSDEAYVRRLQIIEEKLEKRENYLESNSDECFSGAVPLNRHDYEEEINVLSSNTADQLTRCLVTLKPHSDPSIHKDHPINHLQSLEKELFAKSYPPTVESLEKSDTLFSKKRKLPSTSSVPNSKMFICKPSSFWDMKEKPLIVTSKSHPYSSDIHPECESSGKKCNNVCQDFSKPFVWAIDESQLVPMEKLEGNRLSIEELRADPKFSNYDPGKPSSALYIKNLPRQIQPFTLVSVFGRFEKENKALLEYRLLKGKMKGQAFVKFKLLHVAVKAFDLCNGFLIESKPMVIEFSKKIC